LGNINAGTLKYAYSLLSEAQPPPPDLHWRPTAPAKCCWWQDGHACTM